MSEVKKLYGIIGTTYSFETGGSYPSHFVNLYESYREASQALIDCGFTPYSPKKSNNSDGGLFFYQSKLDDGVQLEEEVVMFLTP